MKYKAISLWQPWASLMMTPAKRYETRSWATNYRGPLVICAAKGGLTKEEYEEYVGMTVCGISLADVPRGVALGIVEVVDCLPVEKIGHISSLERQWGNYSPGRFAWKTRLIEVFKEPIPVKGKQGFFWIDI